MLKNLFVTAIFSANLIIIGHFFLLKIPQAHLGQFFLPHMSIRMFKHFSWLKLKRRNKFQCILLPVVTVITFCTFIIGLLWDWLAPAEKIIFNSYEKCLHANLQVKIQARIIKKRIQKPKKNVCVVGKTHRNRSYMVCNHHHSYTSPEFCLCLFFYW